MALTDYLWGDFNRLTSLDIGQVQIEVLIKKYATVFKEGLGTMDNFKAILAVQPDAKSKFHKPGQYLLQLENCWKGIGQIGTGRCAKKSEF